MTPRGKLPWDYTPRRPNQAGRCTVKRLGVDYHAIRES
jgi:hypothetical protein